MLTLYHCPRTRSTRIVALLEELGVRDKVHIETVDVTRNDGSGGADPKNPHPEGKVPLLVHDGVEIWESTAIALYLTEIFPDAGLGRAIGAPDRGRLLSWLAWYGDVLEPVIVMSYAKLDHPALHTTFRGMKEAGARLSKALQHGPYLMGEDYSVADLICASAFQFAPQLSPGAPGIADWVARCSDRPAQKAALDYDETLTAPH